MCFSRKPAATVNVGRIHNSTVPTSKSGGIVPRSVARAIRKEAVAAFRNATKVTGRIKAGCSTNPGRADLGLLVRYAIKDSYKPGLVATINQLADTLDEAYSRAPFRGSAQEFRDFFWREASERLARLDFVLGQAPKLTKEEKAL